VYDQSAGGDVGSWFSGCYKNSEDTCFEADVSKDNGLHTPFTKEALPRFKTKNMKKLKVHSR
jgi:hypothetical protein